MRGKVSCTCWFAFRRRITPAHAGKRTILSIEQPIRRDHPRACGEKDGGQYRWQRTWGSPPRMRGKVDVLPEVHALKGITPAHAGKSTRRTATAPQSRDHPRACGEKICTNEQRPRPRGSPPRMRGKDGSAQHFARVKGITPAHAGKRPGRPASRHLGRDHPRACGEKVPSGRPRSRRKGSPPRMRGKGND